MRIMSRSLLTSGFVWGHKTASMVGLPRLCCSRRTPVRLVRDILPLASVRKVHNLSDGPTWLVVGDGDLSYSACLARDLEPGTRLIATVLEDEASHNMVYRDSLKNTQIIRNIHQQEARFAVDATKLQYIFLEEQFDRIIFNFPHWPGKSNTRYNRELVDKFLCSAAKVLKRSPSSEIHVAFCDKQGGHDATNIREWKSSWRAAAFAADYGLLLRRLDEFQPQYNLSSFRMRDRGFAAGINPQSYVFSWPRADHSLSEYDYRQQIAFHFELRLEMDPGMLSSCPFSGEHLVRGDIIPKLVRECIDEDYHCEVPIRELVRRKVSPIPLLVFLVVYVGYHRPLSRAQAQEFRLRMEQAVSEQLGLDIAKRGQLVSLPFPYHLLQSLIDEYNSTNALSSSTASRTWSGDDEFQHVPFAGTTESRASR